MASSSVPAAPGAPSTGQSQSFLPERARYGEPNERRLYPWAVPEYLDQPRRGGPVHGVDPDSDRRMPPHSPSPSDMIRGRPPQSPSSVQSPKSSDSRRRDYNDSEDSDGDSDYEPNKQRASTQTSVSSQSGLRGVTKHEVHPPASLPPASPQEIPSSKPRSSYPSKAGYHSATVAAWKDGAVNKHTNTSSTSRVKPLTPSGAYPFVNYLPIGSQAATKPDESVPPREPTRRTPATPYDRGPPPPASSFRPGAQAYGATEPAAMHATSYSRSSNQRTAPSSPPLRPYGGEGRPNLPVASGVPSAAPLRTYATQPSQYSATSSYARGGREYGSDRDSPSPPPEDYRPRSLITHGFIGRIGAAPPPPPPRSPSPHDAAYVSRTSAPSYDHPVYDRYVPPTIASGSNLRVESYGASGYPKPKKPYDRPSPTPPPATVHTSLSPPPSQVTSTTLAPGPTSAAAKARRAAAASTDAPKTPGLMTVWAYERAPGGGYKCPVPGCTDAFETVDTVSWHASSAHRGGGIGTYTKYKKVGNRWVCPFENCKWSTTKYRDGTRGITGHVKNHEEGTWCPTCFVTTPPTRTHYCHYQSAVKAGRLVGKEDEPGGGDEEE